MGGETEKPERVFGRRLPWLRWSGAAFEVWEQEVEMASSRKVKCGLFLIVTLLALAATGAGAGEPALWLRYPAISPDGATVAFSYRGDLWTVPATGGAATPADRPRRLRHRSGLVAGRPPDRLRLRPLRQLRRLRHAGRPAARRGG